jgi:hypothetical protein
MIKNNSSSPIAPGFSGCQSLREQEFATHRVEVALNLQPDPVAKPDCRNYRFC